MSNFYAAADLLIECGILMPTMAILLTVTVAKIHTHRRKVTVSMNNIIGMKQMKTENVSGAYHNNGASSQQSLNRTEKRLTGLAIYLVIVYTVLINCFLLRTLEFLRT